MQLSAVAVPVSPGAKRLHGAVRSDGESAHKDQPQRLKKIEAVIHPSTFDLIEPALQSLGAAEITISHVQGCGRSQDVRRTFYRGAQASVLLPKVKVEIVILSARAADAVDVLKRGGGAGAHHSAGRILVYDVVEADSSL